MEEIVKKNKKKKKKKKEREREKEISIETQPLNNNVISSISNIAPDPPFGILKNGKKPVYSEYMKTLLIDKNIKNDKLVITDNNMFGKILMLTMKLIILKTISKVNFKLEKII